MLAWEHGRQDSGYLKKKLFSFSKYFKADCYLLKYPTGSRIGSHKDPVDSGRHYRANLLIKDCGSGGKFICEEVLTRLPRLVIFRPDISQHEVTRIESGTRYMLSVGWVLEK